MAIIKCRLEEGGRLVPSAVEFEPGDSIRFRSDKSVYVLAGSPTLTELQRNVSLTDLGLRISGGLEFLVFPEELVNVHAPTPSGPGHPGITIFLETAGRFTPQED